MRQVVVLVMARLVGCPPPQQQPYYSDGKGNNAFGGGGCVSLSTKSGSKSIDCCGPGC